MRYACVVFALVLSVVTFGAAQTPPPTGDEPKVSAAPSTPVEAELRRLKKQVEELSKPRLSPEEQQVKLRETYTRIFTQAKEQARDACKDTGGRFSVSVESPGSKVTVTCVW